MRYSRTYDEDDYTPRAHHGSSAHREERSLLARVSWRAWVAIGAIAAVLVLCPLSVLFLVALIDDPRGTTTQVTGFFHELIFLAEVLAAVGAVLVVVLIARQGWFAWLFKPFYPRANRMPILVDARGAITQLAQPAPTYDNLRSIHAAGGMPLLEEHAQTGLLEAPEDALIPERGTWESIKSGIAPGHYFLGWTTEGELWGSLETMLTMFAAGQQGFGKTGLARLLTLQGAMTGAEGVIWDFYNDIAAEASGYLRHCYSEPEDVEASAQQLSALIAQRRTLYAAGTRRFPEIFLVVDEWGQFEAHCPMARKVIQDCLDIGRKIGIRLYVSNVRLPAKTIGAAFSKGNVATTYVFITSVAAAATFEITGQRGEALMAALFRAGKGYCIIRSARLGLEGSILALPEISPEVFRQELARLRPRRQMAAAIPRVAAPPPVVAFTVDDPPAWMDDLPPMEPLSPNPVLARSHVESSPPSSSEPSTGQVIPISTLDGFMRKGKEGKGRPRYTEAERVEVLRLHYEEGLAASAIAMKLGRASNWYYVVREIIQAEEARQEEEEAADGDA